MSELTNPLFEEEKEFLERKQLEYERALRGDIEQLKGQSVMVGKVALVGVGLAGGIWLLTKAFSSKPKKRRFEGPESADPSGYDDDQDEQEYYTAGNGKRYPSKRYHRTAQDSAAAFAAADTDDFGFGHSATPPHEALPVEIEDDPFQDLPYDDSRRLPSTHHFEDEPTDHYELLGERKPSVVTSLLTGFLQSDAGKVIIAQAAAVAMALVTKKLNEFFPADKNADLATSPGYAPATGGAAAGATPAPPTPDAIPSNQLPV
jgi:hypothetical protein